MAYSPHQTNHFSENPSFISSGRSQSMIPKKRHSEQMESSYDIEHKRSRPEYDAAYYEDMQVPLQDEKPDVTGMSSFDDYGYNTHPYENDTEYYSVPTDANQYLDQGALNCNMLFQGGYNPNDMNSYDTSWPIPADTASNPLLNSDNPFSQSQQVVIPPFLEESDSDGENEPVSLSIEHGSTSLFVQSDDSLQSFEKNGATNGRPDQKIVQVQSDFDKALGQSCLQKGRRNGTPMEKPLRSAPISAYPSPSTALDSMRERRRAESSLVQKSQPRNQTQAQAQRDTRPMHSGQREVHEQRGISRHTGAPVQGTVYDRSRDPRFASESNRQAAYTHQMTTAPASQMIAASSLQGMQAPRRSRPISQMGTVSRGNSTSPANPFLMPVARTSLMQPTPPPVNRRTPLLGNRFTPSPRSPVSRAAPKIVSKATPATVPASGNSTGVTSTRHAQVGSGRYALPSIPAGNIPPKTQKVNHKAATESSHKGQPKVQETTCDFTESQIRTFEPDGFDHQVLDWRKKGMSWDHVLELSKYSKHHNRSNDLSVIRVRNNLTQSKLALEEKESRDAQLAQEKELRTAQLAQEQELRAAQRAQEQEHRTTQVAQEQEHHTAQLSQDNSSSDASVHPTRRSGNGTTTTAKVHAPKASEQTALSIAVIRQKDQLAWQEERKQMEQSWQEEKEQLQEIRQKVAKDLEAEKARSEKLQIELEKERAALQSKSRVEEELSVQKREAEDLRRKLNDEKLLRTKAEQDYKEHKKAEQRRQLAQAASSRQPAKAQSTGFVFTKNEAQDDGPTLPGKKSQAKKKVQEDVVLREDGYPKHGGKQLSQKVYQSYMKHLERASGDDEQVSEDEEVSEKLQETNLTYFVYTVRRKQWLRAEEEPDVEGMVCGQYTYLNKANESAQREIFRPWGTDGIVIEQDKDFTLQGGRDEDGMCWTQIELPAGLVKVWVEREVHTEFEGELPQFEPRGFLAKTVYVVKEEVDAMANELAEVCTTSDFANRKASERAFGLVWGEKSARLDDMMQRAEAERNAKEKLEDLEDQKQLFLEEFEDKQKRRIKIWVERWRLVGPRN